METTHLTARISTETVILREAAHALDLWARCADGGLLTGAGAGGAMRELAGAVRQSADRLNRLATEGDRA